MRRDRKAATDRPTSVELLWGERPSPNHGRRPGLSLERIARAAIEIADEEGLHAVSMQRVGTHLDYTAMSLYRHVPSKEQLIDVMYDVAIGAPPAVSEQDAGEDRPSAAPDGAAAWRAEVLRWVRAMLECYQRHPWLLRVASTTPPLGPNQLAWLDTLLQAVATTGLREEDMIYLSMFISGAVRDLARTSTEMTHAQETAGVSEEEAGAGYAHAMKRLVDGSRLPTLAAFVSAGGFEPSEEPYNDIMPGLEFGLQRLLDGVESHVRRCEGN